MTQLDSRARRDSVALALQDAVWGTNNKPPSGFGYLIKDSTDGHIKLFLSDGTKVDLQTGGGGGSGTVTSVAPTAGAPGSLFAAGGTPTVAPTYGFAPLGAAGILGALTATTPSALTAQQVSTLLVKEYYGTLAAQAQTLTLSGLDGDTDGMYLVTIEMRSSAAANNLEIQLNGAATNLGCVSANTLVGGVARTDWKLGQFSQDPATFSSGDLWRGTFIMCARSGRIRTLESCSVFVVKGGSVTAWSFAGRYNDTATNVTSLSILASQANGLAAGSFIHCVRIQTSNPLA